MSIMSTMSIPTKREIFFALSTDNEFIERTLLAMYQRHMANKGILNGKGFNRVTKIDGVRLGKWLAGKGNGHFTSGEGTRSTKSRDEHLQKARDVLYPHVDQIIVMMTENLMAAKAAELRGSRTAAAPVAPLAPLAPPRSVPVPSAPVRLSDREQIALNLQRSREIVAMLEEQLASASLNSGKVLPDERITERNVTPWRTPWRGTGFSRTG